MAVKPSEALFTPWKAGNVEFKNRIVHLPMTGPGLIDNQLLSAKMQKDSLDYFLERSQENVGLFYTCTQLTSFMGKRLCDHPEVFDEVKVYLDKIHLTGAKFFTQLSLGAGGRNMPVTPQMIPLFKNRKVLDGMVGKTGLKYWFVGPDDGLPNFWAPEVKMPQIKYETIQDIIYNMGESAKLCKYAGFDGVELHAMHFGYLLDSFAYRYTNHRTDKYGGSLENRARLACELVEEIKKKCGKDYPVSIRLSLTSHAKGFNDAALPGEEYEDAGRTLEESIEMAKLLEKAGVDMWNVDSGCYDALYYCHPPVYMPPNPNLPDAIEFKKHVTKPVICGGKMEPQAAADAISEGLIDAMGAARQFLVDPQYATKIKEDRMEDIRPCIGCHRCIIEAETGGHGVIMPSITLGRCAQATRTLNEKKYAVVPTKKPKKVAVIGGGIGGMECAIQLDKRGHSVDLYEKTGELGGIFRAAAAPSFKERDRMMIEWYKKELAASNVRVHMNTEIRDIAVLDADEIVIATGATVRSLNVPGDGKAVNATDFLLGKESVGDQVAVIGGGVTGSECAYELALQGKHPFIIEMAEYVMKSPREPAMNTMLLRGLLRQKNVPMYVNSKVMELNRDSVVIDTPEGRKTIPCDSAIASIGFIAGTALAAKEGKHVHFIGDVKTVGDIKTANIAANDVVLKIS
jgi:2-enoate reductase